MNSSTVLEQKHEPLSVSERPPLPYLKEIQEGCFLNLVTVHTASRSLSRQYFARNYLHLHGFAVIQSTPQPIKVLKSCFPKKESFKLKPLHASVFYLGPSYLHAPFHVSDALVDAVLANSLYTKQTKKIIRRMQGVWFSTVEHFLRSWFVESCKELKDTLTPVIHEMFYNWAADPFFYNWLHLKSNKTQPSPPLANLLRDASALVHLNMDVNSHMGAVLPMNPNLLFCSNDRDAFEKGECGKPLEYPSISPTLIYELFQQQLSFKNYLEEKLKMGFSVDFQTKLKREPDTRSIMKRLVNFKELPWGDYFLANCNKATSTFLQEAEDISALQGEEKAHAITGASILAIGAGQRMFFWNSRLHQAVINLFVNGEFKRDDAQVLQRTTELTQKPALLNELANNKLYILRVFETWPLQQEKKALEQILNEQTPLGRVFLTKKSTSLPLHDPHPSRGTLKKAANRLAEINRTQALEVELGDSKEIRTFGPG